MLTYRISAKKLAGPAPKVAPPPKSQVNFVSEVATAAATHASETTTTVMTDCRTRFIEAASLLREMFGLWARSMIGDSLSGRKHEGPRGTDTGPHSCRCSGDFRATTSP